MQWKVSQYEANGLTMLKYANRKPKRAQSKLRNKGQPPRGVRPLRLRPLGPVSSIIVLPPALGGRGDLSSLLWVRLVRALIYRLPAHSVGCLCVYKVPAACGRVHIGELDK